MPARRPISIGANPLPSRLLRLALSVASGDTRRANAVSQASQLVVIHGCQFDREPIGRSYRHQSIESVKRLISRGAAGPSALRLPELAGVVLSALVFADGHRLLLPNVALGRQIGRTAVLVNGGS